MATAASPSYASSPPSRQPGGGFWNKLFRSRSATNEAGGNARRGSTAANEGGVFGVALQDSLRYASVAISQVGDDGRPRIYGYIPVVVAKAGLFLKENGTTTPGIFRVSGSNKRIKELEGIFDTPPTYGKDMDWDTYSVHDAASAFRRYLNMLPYPIIPFELYSAFQATLPRPESTPTPAEIATAIEKYRVLINSLPPASQHIFFYTLDLLSVFHRNSEQNLMPASNLATIFQPGLLRHPSTTQSAAPPPAENSSSSSPPDADAVRAVIEADASEHKRSQEVLVFLIEHQDAFELELPKKHKKSTSATTGSPKASTSKAGEETEEGWSMLPKPTVGATGVTRRQSATKRLRRKSHDQAGGDKPVRSKPSEAAKSSDPATSIAPVAEADEKRPWSPFRSRKSIDSRRPDEDAEVIKAVARVGIADPPPDITRAVQRVGLAEPGLAKSKSSRKSLSPANSPLIGTSPLPSTSSPRPSTEAPSS